MSLIEIDQGEFGYDGRPVVRVEQLDLSAGAATGIFGPNGAGKTTLVRGITGLLAPLNGKVQRAGNLRIAYLPQHSAMQSHWPLSGFDAAAMVVSSLRPMGWLNSSDHAAVRDMMRKLSADDLAPRPFFALSGGQQQRILLAGAMAIRPQVLVLDEPTAGLDVRSRRTLLDLLIDFTAQGLCSVMISHEIEDLIEACAQVAWVHPADQPRRPSSVQVIRPDELVQLLTHQHR